MLAMRTDRFQSIGSRYGKSHRLKSRRAVRTMSLSKRSDSVRISKAWQTATGLAATDPYLGGDAWVILTECLAFQRLSPRRMQRNIKFHQADGDEIQAVDTTGGA